jgi:hypothetical protein
MKVEYKKSTEIIKLEEDIRLKAELEIFKIQLISKFEQYIENPEGFIDEMGELKSDIEVAIILFEEYRYIVVDYDIKISPIVSLLKSMQTKIRLTAIRFQSQID